MSLQYGHVILVSGYLVFTGVNHNLENNRKWSHKFCIRIESNSQKAFYCIVLYTNMAVVTSDANHQLAGVWAPRRALNLSPQYGNVILVTLAYMEGWTCVRRGRRASGDGSVRSIFLGGKSRDNVAFGNPRFSGGISH